MAQVLDIKLAMGRVNSKTEFAEVTFAIAFSPQEVKENLTFGLYIALFEIDDDLDTYHFEANGLSKVSVNWRAIGNLDEFIVSIASEQIRPNGSHSLSLRRRSEFDVGNQEAGNEEYKALVWVIPEIVEGKAWSNTLSINLG